MTEELRAQMEALRAIAPRLNGATNQAAAAIKAADDFLAELSLGVPAVSGPYEERTANDPDDALTGKDMVFSYLAYGRLGVTGRYAIHVVRRTERPVVDSWGNIESWETIDEVAQPWSTCPRDEKLKAFAKLPNLLGNIADAAKVLTEQAEETSAMVGTMFGEMILEPDDGLPGNEDEPKDGAAGPVRRSKPKKGALRRTGLPSKNRLDSGVTLPTGKVWWRRGCDILLAESVTIAELFDMPYIIARGGLVTVRDLAEAIGADRSNTSKWLKKLGIAMEKRRCPEARGQFVSVIRLADAKRIIDLRKSQTLAETGEVVEVHAIRFVEGDPSLLRAVSVIRGADNP